MNAGCGRKILPECLVKSKPAGKQWCAERYRFGLRFIAFSRGFFYSVTLKILLYDVIELLFRTSVFQAKRLTDARKLLPIPIVPAKFLK